MSGWWGEIPYYRPLRLLTFTSVYTNLSCIVLAGGQSKRMGEDKAFLTLNGKSFLRIICEKLSSRCTQLILSANREEELYARELGGINFEFVKDINPYDGPLNGIVSTIEKIKNEYVFITTCDTPLLEERLIDLYMDIIGEYEAVIPQIEGKLQPLNTLYKKLALEKAKEAYRESKSLLSLVDRLKFITPQMEKIKEVDRELSSYRSINTRQQYQSLIRKT